MLLRQTAGHSKSVGVYAQSTSAVISGRSAGHKIAVLVVVFLPLSDAFSFYQQDEK